MTRTADFIAFRRIVWITCLCATVTATPALADRHCSFARQSAFYAREFSAEAEKAAANECAQKNTEALDRLNDAMAELEICSCAAAEEPLRRWLGDRAGPKGATERSCRAEARAINTISKTVLSRVETCF